MTLSELQRAQVSRRLKALCDRRCPAQVRHQVRLDFRLGTHDVVLFESRPTFQALHEWRDEDIAKFRFVAAANEWRLFCQFRDLKWRAYQPLASAPDFETLLQEVDRDPTGIFWG